MENFDELLKQLEQQEAELQFANFTNRAAYDLGRMLIDIAQSENLSITTDITRGRQQLFHCALEGTSADNDRWIKGKSNLVNLTGHSSYYYEIKLKAEQKTIEEGMNLPGNEYFANGGSFPIRVMDVGVIGTISVSGLTSSEDHALIVRAVKKFLSA
jgi:uncharacterized protein (UPF0303 family)